MKVVYIILVLLISACSSNRGEPISPDKELANGVVTTLRFTQYACPNEYCDNYLLEVVGSSVTKSNGKIISKNTLSRSQQNELVELINDLNLRAMKTLVKPHSSYCQSYSTDQASYKLILDKGDFNQTLDVYGGCNELPVSYRTMINWFHKLSEIPTADS